jgi:UDP-N-acetylglucosamine diphosphorylase/glucosamine-1-phosphate N-acetyltransferase
MKIFLLDIAENRTQLMPLTYTRSIAELRVGILKIYEKWELRLKGRSSFITENYLGKKNVLSTSESNLVINSSVCPDENLAAAICYLKVGQKLIKDGNLIAVKTSSVPKLGDSFDLNFKSIDYAREVTLIERPQDIFTRNGEQIRKDFELVTAGRKSSEIYDPHSIIYNKEDVFLEEGAVIKACILNAENGPIYLGKNAVVSEGAIIKGPFALGEYGQVSLGAKIRGDSTFGPYTKVGGEVSNSVIMGYSNKSHEGYMGNSVIGEWCNLGADTNTSNMKNNYSNVKIWDYSQESFGDSGLQFYGLIMGDHSKCGINTMFNTGTVAGVSTNIFGAGYPKFFIPSFSWGGSSGFETYQLQKAIQTASIAMQRKGKQLSNIDIGIFEHIFEQSSKYRTW